MVKKSYGLSDLYVPGKEYARRGFVADPSNPGEKLEVEVKVWLSKLNPIEQKAAVKKAGAAKTKALLDKRDKGSDEYLNLYGQVLELNRETLVDYAISQERNKQEQILEEKVAGEDEWTEDEYLTSLKDSYAEKYNEILLRGEESEDFDQDEFDEATRVRTELERYAGQVEKLIEDEVVQLKRSLEGATDEELQDKVAELFLDLRASQDWTETWYQWQVFYAVKNSETDHTRHFKSIDDIQAMEQGMYLELLAAYRDIEIDPFETKKSQETTDS